MSGSILDDVKKLLGIGQDYLQFDQDLIIHINSVFFDLHQLGVGPDDEFSISDNSTTWDAFIGADHKWDAVKTYMGLRVRLIFDPPTSSIAVDSYQKMIDKYEWMLNVKREGESWTDPFVTPT